MLFGAASFPFQRRKPNSNIIPHHWRACVSRFPYLQRSCRNLQPTFLNLFPFVLRVRRSMTLIPPSPVLWVFSAHRAQRPCIVTTPAHFTKPRSFALLGSPTPFLMLLGQDIAAGLPTFGLRALQSGRPLFFDLRDDRPPHT
ncbi:unnamed protein product [Periconia digitata]|uniref:Uncharacterized protein n=1 Tax=Periconia digitata TaxID=1303443 RepID=A0A9W4UPF4_9PLEO|nr:unnamed protein product [Periconia digitata]